MRPLAPLLLVMCALGACAAAEQSTSTPTVVTGPAGAAASQDTLVPPALPRNDAPTTSTATQPAVTEAVDDTALEVSPVSGLDDRAPAPDHSRTDDPTDSDPALNAVGNPVTLDESGSLACAAAEVLLTTLEEATDPAVALARLREHGSTTNNVDLRAAVTALDGDVVTERIVEILDVCILGGHEL